MRAASARSRSCPSRRTRTAPSCASSANSNRAVLRLFVDVEAEVAEEAQDGAVRVRLHRVAQREAEGVREGERRARRGLERRAVVDVARRAEALAHQGRLGRGEEHGAQRIIRGRANANRTRPTIVEPSAVDAATQRIVRVEPGAMATLRFTKL